MTEDILRVANHWSSLDMQFDAIGVGYLADPAQSEAVISVLEQFPAYKVVDPVMGDHGKLYSSITPEHIEGMKLLCAKGNLLLPNVTEAAFLTGLPYREQADAVYLQELCRGMLDFGAQAVVLTGVSGKTGRIGFYGRESAGDFSYEAPCIPASFHGTGDLFAAVVLGGQMMGKSLQKSAELAAGFVERVLTHSGMPTPHGVCFEKQLPWLWKQSSQCE